MRIKQLAFAFIAASLCSVSALAQGLSIEKLAGDHVNIRISANEQSKYLLLPIEEKAAEANIRVIRNNELVRTINVRLALSHIDYYVPYIIDKHEGMDLLLEAHIPVDHSNRGGVSSEICLSNITLSDTFDATNIEKFRPDFHHTPEYAWMNDPNGMFYLNGEWHLYYQYGPYGSMWNNMTWGHSVSKDLINWEHREPALWGDALGAIFSGSCIIDHENTAGFGKDAVVAMYTSARPTAFGCDIQEQSLAYSLDGGNTFTKYENNPVLTADIPDFRDPNPFWNEEIGKWNLIMASGQEMRLYSSPNLKDWTEESRFGLGIGGHGGVWECPDLFPLPNPKAKNSKFRTPAQKWVLVCNINPGGPMGGSATQYFIGDFDGHKFTVDNPERYQNGGLWMDYGKDHYATVSFYNGPDNRRTVVAWMSNWEYANDVPTMQFRSANSIARDMFLYEGQDGELYVGSRPSPEYDGAGLDKQFKVKGSTTWTLSNNEGEEVKIVYDQNLMTLSVDRTKSGEVNFNQNFACVTTAPVHNKLTSLRVFIDKCSIEVFGNDGEVVLTNLIFPKSPLDKVRVSK
ncbi:MAG: DUF4980 domain-containing protein [Prevotellaceae bacterium]|nr:DUF4980 domain-containing protein [Prevotellaceae bacterium]